MLINTVKVWGLDEHSTRNCFNCHVTKVNSIKCIKGFDLKGTYNEILRKPILKEICGNCIEFKDFKEDK